MEDIPYMPENIKRMDDNITTAVYDINVQKRNKTEKYLQEIGLTEEIITNLKRNGYKPVLWQNVHGDIIRVVIEPYNKLGRVDYWALPEDQRKYFAHTYDLDEEQSMNLQDTHFDLYPELEEQAEQAVEKRFAKKNWNNPSAWMDTFISIFNNIEYHYVGVEDKASVVMGRLESSFKAAKRRGSTVHFVGNGGSASICDHISQDFFTKWGIKTMTYSSPALMSRNANDVGWENVFSEALEKTISKHDILVAISSSGRSQNILNAMSVADKKGAFIVAITGMDKYKNKITKKSNILFDIHIPSNIYGHIEVATEALLHSLIDFYEE